MMYQEASLYTPSLLSSKAAAGSNDATADYGSNIMSYYGLEITTANQLRLGKPCMIGGHPCKIKSISRSAPGKHGHTKHRTTGVGILDKKKRDTIFVGHDQIQVPKIENRTIIAKKTQDGNYFIDESLNVHEVRNGLPSMLRAPAEMSAENDDDESNGNDADVASVTAQEYVELAITIVCRHYVVTDCKVMTEDQIVAATAAAKGRANQSEQGATNGTGGDGGAPLSKKDQRKLKKQLKKAAKVSVETAPAATVTMA